MTNVVSYTRVSTLEQKRQGVSPEAQAAAIRAYCQMKCFTIMEEISDIGISASKPLHTRPGGARALELLRTGKATCIVATKLDRLFRDCAECLNVIKGWDKAGISMHLLDMGGASIDTQGAMGRFFLTIMAAAAEMERNMVRERTRVVKAHQKEKSEYLGGDVPYGYQLTTEPLRWVPGRKVDDPPRPVYGIIAHPHEQHIIVAAKQFRAGGLSFCKIARRLEEQGYLPRRTPHWHPDTIMGLVKSEVAA